MPIHLTSRDLIVILAVSIQATAVAYSHQAKWKAILLSLPVPSTFMMWAGRSPVDATTILGVAGFFGYMQLVRWLYQVKRVPIVPAIAGAAVLYCLVAAGLAAAIPRTPASFWLATGFSFCLGLAMYRVLPYRAEPGQRSELPVWLKWPIIAGIILFLISARGLLHGFAVTFPIVGTITCYEARRSLWTSARQAAVILMVLAIAFTGPYLTVARIGLIPSLVVAWLLWAATFIPFTLYQWSHVPTGVVAKPA
jgi:hypothetical protein